jgi:phosphopantothenoylcysteine decarboxylase
MWAQRITAQHLAVLEGRGVHVIPPVEKVLACGDSGVGAMAAVEDIVGRAASLMAEQDAARQRAVEEGKLPFA